MRVEMFQFLFNENNQLKSELIELKESNAEILSELKKLRTDFVSTTNNNITSGIKDVKNK